MLSLYRPDVARLRAGTPPVVVAFGEESAGRTMHQIAVALADQLGTRLVQFPGDHGGYGLHAESFAGCLHRALGNP